MDRGLRETIAICTPSDTNPKALRVVEEKRMTTRLDEERMAIYVIYNGTRHYTQGNAFFMYIVV